MLVMRLVPLFLAVAVLVPACGEPASPLEEDESSSGGLETTSSGSSSEESTATCDTTIGWCAEACILPTGPEVVATAGLRSGNVCSVISNVAMNIDCESLDTDWQGCWKTIAEVYGGGRYGGRPEDGATMVPMDLWEMALLWWTAGGAAETCVSLEPACEILSYDDCMDASREIDEAQDQPGREYACREIATRYPAAGLPPADWP